jgi:hypothetical protein
MGIDKIVPMAYPTLLNRMMSNSCFPFRSIKNLRDKYNEKPWEELRISKSQRSL